VAGQALTVTFLTHWQLVADFNSVLTSPLARERDFDQKQNWRCLLSDVRTFFAENPAI
jgi:hypothetical protein